MEFPLQYPILNSSNHDKQDVIHVLLGLSKIMKLKSSAEIKRDCCLFNTKYYEDKYDLYSCSMQQLVIFFK